MKYVTTYKMNEEIKGTNVTDTQRTSMNWVYFNYTSWGTSSASCSLFLYVCVTGKYGL